MAAPEAALSGRVLDLGLVPYAEALELQRRLVAERAAEAIPDTLLLVEHPPVLTAGRKLRDLAGVHVPAGVELFAVERGGELTYHAPGQLVGYPIVRLPEDRRDLHAILRDLEEALIQVLAGYGLAGCRQAGLTGVWAFPAGSRSAAPARKVASLGIAVRRWVTFHGFALNVDLDLTPYEALVPCGLPGAVMASVASLGGRAPGGAPPRIDADLKAAVVRQVGDGLGVRFAWPPTDSMGEKA